MSVSEYLSIVNDDDFEGSNDEISISQEVFYGIDSTGGARRKLSEFISFGCQQHKFVESSPSINTGAFTSQSSSKVPCLKDGNNVIGGSLRTCPSASLTEGFVLAERNDGHTVPAKRLKLSVDELSGFKPLLQTALDSDVPLKALVSGFDHPKGQLDSNIVMCHVVESSGEGVSSSCYLLKHGLETEKNCCLLDTVLPNDNLVVSEGSEGKEIVVSNTMASPISQESCATKTIVTSPALTSVDNTGSCQRAVRKRKKGTPVELDDDDDIPWTSDCKKELRPFLRNRMLRLLTAAGWSIEKRKRQCRSYEEFVYVSPHQRNVRELAKAWNVCGQILHAHKEKQMGAEDGRQWANMDHLCSDLYNTITNMDNEMKCLEPKDSIVRQWILLNPFVTVVFVDRKLRELRAGNVVEVKLNASDNGEKSLVRKGKRSGGGCTTRKPCDSSLANESTVIDFGIQCQEGKVEASTSRSIYVSEGICMRLLETDDKVGIRSGYVCTNDSEHQFSPSLPAHGSNMTLLQPANDLYDVPVDSGNVHFIPRVSQEFAAQQYDASDAVMDEPNQLCAEDAKCRQRLDSSTLRNVRTDGHLVSKSKGKQKKSKKVCEIELSLLSEEEMSKLLTPSRVEGGSEKMNDHTNKENKSCKRLSSSSKSCKKRTARKKTLPFKLKDDDLLISAIAQQKKFKSNRKKCNVKADNKVRRLKKRKNHKGGCRLLPRKSGKGGRHIPDERWTLIAERMILSWLLHTNVVFLNEIIQYRDLKDETVVKDGMITRDGILCRCCDKVFSISGFNTHAGLEMNSLCLNLFMESDQPFTLRLLEAWSAEYRARKAGLRAVQSDEFDQNDDSCGLCGDGGELLCCDRCPSTFHQSCLSAEELPEGSWYCTSCTCWICGDLVDDEGSSAHFGLKCYQCEHKYHLTCLQELGVDRSCSYTSFCSASCKEVHTGLQSQVALYNTLADGFSWSVLKCFQDDQNVHSAQQLALKAECNSKLAVALTIMEECFVSMVDSRTGIDMIPQVVYNWGSEFPRLDYHGFYTVVLEKDDVLISVASIRVHGVEVAEMPLVATCSKYRRKGMCRRLISAVEQMLISFKVEKLVVAAIPDLVETWTVGFGFVPVEEEEKKSLNKINLMVFPGTVVLKKTLYREQPAGLQGAGLVEVESSLGMGISVEEGAFSEERFENKTENNEYISAEDAGFMNVKLFTPRGMEVVEAQKTSVFCFDTQKRESTDSETAASGGCMSLEACGHPESNDSHDVSPQKEISGTVEAMQMQVSYTNIMTGASVDSTNDACNSPGTDDSHEVSPQKEISGTVEAMQMQVNFTDIMTGASMDSTNDACKSPETDDSHDVSAQNEITRTVEDMQMQVNFTDIMTGASMDSTIDACNPPGNGNSQECSFSHEVVHHEIIQHEVSFAVSSEDQKQMTPLPVLKDDADKCIEQGDEVASEVASEAIGNRNSPLLQEGAVLDETSQEAGVAPQEASSPKNPSHPCSSVALEGQTNAKLQLV